MPPRRCENLQNDAPTVPTCPCQSSPQTKMASTHADMSQPCYLGIRRYGSPLQWILLSTHVLICSRLSSLQNMTCILQVGMEHVFIFLVGVNNHILLLGLLSYFQLPAPALSPASLWACSQSGGSVHCWKAGVRFSSSHSYLSTSTAYWETDHFCEVCCSGSSAWAEIAVGIAWTKCAFRCISMSVYSHWMHTLLLPPSKAQWASSFVKFLVSKRRWSFFSCIIYSISEDEVGAIVILVTLN